MASITGFNVNFHINFGGIVIPSVTIQDSTDYPGQGLSTANLNGNLKITAPSGVVIHDNSDFTDGGCDMPATNFPSTLHIYLPLMTSGVVQPGEYTILYTVYNKATSVYYALQRIVDYTYVRPAVDVDITVDYDMTLFVSDDQTNYTVDNIVPTIYSYAHNLYYPHGSAGEGSPIITSDLIIKTATFYPGTQSTTIRATAIWAYITTVGNTFYVLDTVAGTIDTLVSTNDLCSYYCCIKKLRDRVKEARCKNHASLDELVHLEAQVNYLVMLIGIAKTCGHTNDISGYLDEIKSLLGCSDDCDEC